MCLWLSPMTPKQSSLNQELNQNVIYFMTIFTFAVKCFNLLLFHVSKKNRDMTIVFRKQEMRMHAPKFVQLRWTE